MVDTNSLRAGDNIQEQWTIKTKLAVLDEIDQLRKQVQTTATATTTARAKAARAIPSHWPPHYNSNNPCDTINCPCCCGSWHDFQEGWIQDNCKKYGMFE